jgi:tetratricopeptide (TPR) repeat protein
LALADLFGGDWDQAQRYGRQSLESSPNVLASISARLALATLASMRGDVEGVNEQVTAVDGATDPSDQQTFASLLAIQAMQAWVARDFAVALDLGTKAAEGARQLGGHSQGVHRLALPLAIESALTIGKTDLAKTLIGVVVDAPVGLVPPFLHAEAARLGGRLADARGDSNQAEAMLVQAVEDFGDLGYPYWGALAQRDLGGFLANARRPRDARPRLEQALETFTRLEAWPAVTATQELLDRCNN